MNARNNKFLIIKPDVVLTPVIEPVIVALDKWFEQADEMAFVTSGERTSEMQLETIKKYCRRYKIDAEFPGITDSTVVDKITFEGKAVFSWQPAWSRLLNIGVIINPPLPAECLFDYWREGRNKRGSIIGYSPHFFGKAFDIGGGIDHDITNELKVIKPAVGVVPGLVGILPERKNNCVHCDCRAV